MILIFFDNSPLQSQGSKMHIMNNHKCLTKRYCHVHQNDFHSTPGPDVLPDGGYPTAQHGEGASGRLHPLEIPGSRGVL
ncbi:protein of unknown function [Rhodovastum atsumiense]|nr:protein of unknown function [Rhodovastum atsumiense]